MSDAPREPEFGLKLSDAADIVLDLARENVIDDPEMEDVAARQEAAIEMVREHLGRP